MTPQPLLCRLGWHRWHEVLLPIEINRWMESPSLPHGVGFLRVSDDGKTWVIDYGYRCRCCGKRRSV